MKKFLIRFITVMAIATMAFYVSVSFTDEAFAQQATADLEQQIGKRIDGTSLDFMARYTARVDKVTGALNGPFDVLVGVTDKAEHTMKYHNVPFIMLGNGFVAFPAGTATKGKPDYIIASNFTLYLRD